MLLIVKFCHTLPIQLFIEKCPMKCLTISALWNHFISFASLTAQLRRVNKRLNVLAKIFVLIGIICCCCCCLCSAVRRNILATISFFLVIHHFNMKINEEQMKSVFNVSDQTTAVTARLQNKS